MMSAALRVTDAFSLLAAALFAGLDEGPLPRDLVLMAALLAPFMLHDRRFGSIAARGRIGPLVSSLIVRFGILAVTVITLSAIVGMVTTADTGPVARWGAGALALAMLVRLTAFMWIQQVLRRRHAGEVVAIVGGGPAADQLAAILSTGHGSAARILGVFDDDPTRLAACAASEVGSIDQLLEIGKSCRIDWILITLPHDDEPGLLETVGRLKALSAPIALCADRLAGAANAQHIGFVADGIPVALVAHAPRRLNEVLLTSTAGALPRWVVTISCLAWHILSRLIRPYARRMLQRVPITRSPRRIALQVEFDDCDTERFAAIAANFGEQRFGFVVTPNADHLIRLHDDAEFRAHYAAASHVLLDSQFVAGILRRARGLALPVCPGSDLTAKLLTDIVRRTDRLVLVGGTERQAAEIRRRYGLEHLAHFNPPMGFARDPAAIAACLDFIEAHSPFRFCLLAVGAPQQEMLASRLKARGRARGLALCVGASIDFLTGKEHRAPAWVQNAGMEWAYRLGSSPRRMAYRYLIRGPRVFGLLRDAQISLRQVEAPAALAEPTVATANPAPVPSSTEPTDHAARGASAYAAAPLRRSAGSDHGTAARRGPSAGRGCASGHSSVAPSPLRTG